jgi:hypothetical protein
VDIEGIASRAAAEAYVKRAAEAPAQSDAFARVGGVNFVTVDGTRGWIAYSAPLNRRSSERTTRAYFGSDAVRLR